MEDIDFKMCGN